MARETLNKHRKEGTSFHAPDDWDKWLEFFFPKSVTAPFAQRHVELWEWIETLTPDVRPRPFVAIWGRGGAKSSSVELGVGRLAAKGTRKYAWYVSETQDQADKHVGSVGALLVNNKINQYYPKVATRALTKYGSSKGWRRNRLRTASGFTIDALGLDTAGRGAKIDDQRPDLIILDDIDDKFDSNAMALKKLGIISASILAAGSNDCAVLFIQNMISPDSIASRLVDGRADILSDKILSGPFKAIDGLQYVTVSGQTTITGGTPTWEGQNLEVCQGNINTWGLMSFLSEAQHEVDNLGGQWSYVEFREVEWGNLPKFVKTVVWVDPAVTSTDQSDSQGICAAGLGVDGKKYMLYAWEGILDPEKAMEMAIEKGIELNASHVGIETDQGGDTWRSVYNEAVRKIKERRPNERLKIPDFASDKAGAGYGPKGERNARMMSDYDRGNVYHASGSPAALRRSLLRFPVKPLDLADAAFWAWVDLEDNGPSDEELTQYGADVIKEEEVDELVSDDAIAYEMDSFGLTYEEARAKLTNKKVRT